MIQSITFGDTLVLDEKRGTWKIDGKNTWDDWKILPTERPVFAPPKPKTTYIDIPGGNGTLDLSESLTRYPIYNNRTGSFTFRVMNDYGNWAERYSEIMEYLHGRSMKAVLEDDDQWFYQGRFSVEEWRSGDTWSEITIGYDVNPFKWSVFSTTDPWIWDPFNFDTGIIYEKTFKNIEINSSSIGSSDGSTVEGTWDYIWFDTVLFGLAPVSPTITITDAPLTGIDIRFINTYLDIDVTRNLKNGSTFVPDIIFYGQKDAYEMRFRGMGKVSIDFRHGRL